MKGRDEPADRRLPATRLAHETERLAAMDVEGDVGAAWRVPIFRWNTAPAVTGNSLTTLRERDQNLARRDRLGDGSIRCGLGDDDRAGAVFCGARLDRIEACEDVLAGADRVRQRRRLGVLVTGAGPRAVARLGARTGSSCVQRGCALRQRGAKRQPGGGVIRSGGRPGMV